MLVGVIVIALSAAYFVSATSLSTALSEDVLGPRVFPQLIAVLAAFLGVLVVANAFRRGSSSGIVADANADATPWRVYVTAALYGAYVWALVPLGYLISTALFALITLPILGLRGRVGPPLIALAMTAALFLALRLLNVPVPLGPLGPGPV